MRVYQVKNTEGTVFGYFRSEWKAQQRIDTMNESRIHRLMIQAHRLTGIKRGKNVEKWNNLVTEIATPFYVIVDLLVD